MLTIEQDQDALLEKALQHVPFDGWSDEVIARAAQELSLDMNYVKTTLCPEGVVSLVQLFAKQTDEKMLAALGNMDLDAMRIRDRIAACVKARISLFDQQQLLISMTLRFYANPSHASLAYEHMFRAADHMWHAAGDRSTDGNYYSKRVLLSGVYSSTLLYWLSDESDD